MRPISTTTHGLIDYLMGLVLIAAPFVLNFRSADNPAAVYVPVLLGDGRDPL